MGNDRWFWANWAGLVLMAVGVIILVAFAVSLA